MARPPIPPIASTEVTGGSKTREKEVGDQHKDVNTAPDPLWGIRVCVLLHKKGSRLAGVFGKHGGHEKALVARVVAAAGWLTFQPYGLHSQHKGH